MDLDRNKENKRIAKELLQRGVNRNLHDKRIVDYFGADHELTKCFSSEECLSKLLNNHDVINIYSKDGSLNEAGRVILRGLLVNGLDARSYSWEDLKEIYYGEPSEALVDEFQATEVIYIENAYDDFYDFPTSLGDPYRLQLLIDNVLKDDRLILTTSSAKLSDWKWFSPRFLYQLESIAYEVPYVGRC